VTSIREFIGRNNERNAPDHRVRVVTVTVQKPWPGNPWEEYDFASNTLDVGEEVEINWSYAEGTRVLPSAADLDAVAEEAKVKEGTNAD
jgi:hypothetical protein